MASPLNLDVGISGSASSGIEGGTIGGITQGGSGGAGQDRWVLIVGLLALVGALLFLGWLVTRK